MRGHLIHIGYPKSGSNFLRRWFAQHPQLSFAEGSVAGFRDVYQMVRAAAGRSEVTSYHVTSCEGFATPLEGFGHRPADHTVAPQVPMGQAQEAACRNLRELFPNANVLIVTRGFRGAILSMYSQYVRTGGPLDFADFCASIERAIPQREDGWDYGFLIGMYEKAFGEENVIVLPYELLRDDADSFTRALEQRLGLDHFAPSSEKMNASLAAEEMAWYPRFSRLIRRVGNARVTRFYAKQAMKNRLRAPIRLLQSLRPVAPPTIDSIPETLLAAYRGRADCLRGRPLYAPYEAEYLIM